MRLLARGHGPFRRCVGLLVANFYLSVLLDLLVRGRGPFRLWIALVVAISDSFRPSHPVRFPKSSLLFVLLAIPSVRV